MRVWLKFERADAVAYISHLDAHRAYYRMFRRAGIPLKMSQGFNPHPILSLAAPLPLGFRSQADYIDISLAEDMASGDIRQRLSSVTGGEHLRLIDLGVISFKAPALAGLIDWGRYEIQVTGEPRALLKSCTGFAQQAEVKFIKETKRGSKELDAKLLTRELSCIEGTVHAVLALGQAAVFRPEELLELLEVDPDAYTVVTRQELYIQRDTLFTPLEWVALEREARVGRNGE